MPELTNVIDLAGGNGDGEPTIDNDLVCFNGRTKCNHLDKDLWITWPSKNASGIAIPREESLMNFSQ